MQRWLLAIALVSLAVFTNCGGGGSSPSTNGSGGTGSGQVTLQSITVSPTTASIAPGTTQAFTAVGMYSDGSSKDLTLAAQWSCLVPQIATVGNTSPTQGKTMAVSPGNAIITASMSGVSGNATLMVKNVTAQTLTVTPATATIGFGTQQQFTAIATFSDMSQQDVTELTSWGPIFPPFITSNTGLAVGENVQSNTMVSATFSAGPFGLYGSASPTTLPTLTVDLSNLASIAIMPGNATIANRTPQEFSAMGTFTDGSTRDVTHLVSSWSSSNFAVGSFGFSGSSLNAIGTGTTMVTASICTVFNQMTFTCTSMITSPVATLTVSNAILQSLVVFPMNPPANNTLAPNTKLSYRAIGFFNDGSLQDLTKSVKWSVSNPTIASVSVDDGTLTALSTGLGTTQSTMVTAASSASLGSVQGMSSINVDDNAMFQSIAVVPATTFTAPGASVTYTATGTFMDPSTQATTTQDLTEATLWSSNSKFVASTISNVATGQGVGHVSVSAKFTPNPSSGPVSGTANLEVASPQQISLAVTPATIQIAPQTSTPLKVIATFVDGTTQDLTTSVAWSSNMPNVATVGGQTGVVSGLAPSQTGQTPTITATLGTLTSTSQVTVTNATLQSIKISPPNPNPIGVGSTQQLTATGTFSDGTTQDVTTSISWSAAESQSAPGVAMVSPTGIVTGLVSGTSPATITATSGTVSAFVPITVN